MNLKNLFIFFLFYLPIAPLFEKYIPFQVFSNSLWITVVPIVTFSFIFLFKLNKLRKIDFYLLSMIIISLCIILAIRILMYSNLESVDLIGKIYILYPIFFIIFLRNEKFKQSDFKIINQILLLHISFGSITGLLYLFGYDTIQVRGEETLEFLFTRFTGIYGGANVYSNLMVTFYITLVSLNRKNISLIFLSSVLLIPILISSGSRLPLLLFLLTLLFISTTKLKIKTLYTLVFFWIFLLIISSYYLDFGLNNAFIRLSTLSEGDTGGRVEKFLLAIKLLFSTLGSFIFGVDKTLLSQGVGISDNSLTLIFVSFGTIFSFLWIAFCITISHIKFKIVKKSASLKFFIFCMFCVFIFNNSIVWLVWVYCSIFGLYLIYNNQLLNTR